MECMVQATTGHYIQITTKIKYDLLNNYHMYRKCLNPLCRDCQNHTWTKYMHIISCFYLLLLPSLELLCSFVINVSELASLFISNPHPSTSTYHHNRLQTMTLPCPVLPLLLFFIYLYYYYFFLVLNFLVTVFFFSLGQGEDS